MTNHASDDCRTCHEASTENSLRAIVENAPDIFARFDGNLRHLYINPAIERLIGRPREEFAGKTNEELGMPEELVTCWSEAIHEIFRTGGEKTIEFEFPTSTGVRTFQSRLAPEYAPDGSVRSVIVISRDITKIERLRKEAECALRESLRDRKWMAAMESVMAAGISPIRMDDLLRILAERVAEALDANSCHILILDEETGQFVSRVAYNVPEPPDFRTDARKGFEGRIYTKRRTVYVADAEHDPLVIDPYLKSAGVKSLLGTPLIIRGRIVGVMYVDTLQERRFSREEVRLLKDMAFRAALVIENARLRDELEAHGQEMEATLEKEVHLSRLLQRALLPTIPDRVNGYALASVYIPAYAEREIGGDFYDVFNAADGRTCILIGDVSGKGLESASFAAATRSTIRAFAYELPSPAEVLTHANAVLSTIKEDPTLFVTVFLAMIDQQTGDFRYAGAGHPPAALYGAGRGVEFLAYGNPPLGLFRDLPYSDASSRMNSGDKLIVYTDGITEARHDSEMFETVGIERALKEYGNLSPDEIAGRLVAAANKWAHGRLTDDIAILVVERLVGA